MQLKVEQFKRCEIVLHSTKAYDNPFMDVEINAVFTDENGKTVALPGFWNGENEWKVRFSSDQAGVWQYSVSASDGNESLADAGTITVTAAEPKNDLQKHGYVRLEKGKRHMVYGDGTPFFYLGDTHWQMPDYERLDECNYPGCNCGNQFKHLADDRIKKGFTVYQTYFDSAESDGGGNKRRHHWWTEKYTLINPKAFNDTMDQMMEYLADNGITVAMGFGVHYATTVAMRFDPKPLLAFARYCVARYACYPVVWITAQEISNLTGTTYELWQAVGTLVGELDGFHRPNGAHQHVHPANELRSVIMNSLPWHQWFALQAGHGGIKRLQPRSFYQGYHDLKEKKVYIETECHYEDIYCSGFCGSEASRIGAWKAVLSGSAGFTYGVTGVWAMEWNDTNDRGWLPYSPEPWYVGMDKPGSTEMTYLRKFFEYIGWAELEPVFGYDFGAFECRRDVSIAHKGTDLFVYYFAGSDAETGLLKGLDVNRKYQARWYDPIHGAFLDLPDVISADGSALVPQKPSRRDWVLLMNAEDLGAYETIAYPVYKNTIAPENATPGEKFAIKNIWTSEALPGHDAANLIDGDPATNWQGLAPCVSETIIADLGEAKEVGWFRIVSDLENPIYICYRVYGSVDGKKYDLISERPVFGAVGIGGQYKEFYDFLDGKYQYIKVFFNSTEQRPQLSLTAFEIYGK